MRVMAACEDPEWAAVNCASRQMWDGWFLGLDHGLEVETKSTIDMKGIEKRSASCSSGDRRRRTTQQSHATYVSMWKLFAS